MHDKGIIMSQPYAQQFDSFILFVNHCIELFDYLLFISTLWELPCTTETVSRQHKEMVSNGL